MEFDVFKYGAYLMSSVVGWFVGVIWNRQEKIKEDISNMKEDLPLNYVRKDEFKDVIQELKSGFKEVVAPILSKLDRMEIRMEEQAREIERTYQRKHGQ